MRIVAWCLSIALAGLSATPALAQCRCAGCGAPAAAAVPQDRIFWDARSGRYLFYASSPQTWYSWQPEQRQWVAVTPTPQGAAPAAPPAQLPPAQTTGPAASDQHQHSHGTQPTTVPQPAPTTQAQAPYGGQRTCPVMDEELGAHGTPIPVTVRGQTIYVCCKGCVRKVQADPDKYLAKVAEERARLSANARGQ